MEQTKKEEHFFQILPTLTVIATTACVIFLPLYIYGWLQFRKHKDSIIINKRFPAVSVLTSLVSFASGLAVMTRFWFQYLTRIHSLSVAFSAGFGFVVDCLITLRLMLVYLRYKQTQHALLYLQSTDLPSSASTRSHSTQSPTPMQPASPSASSLSLFDPPPSPPKQRTNLYLRPACVALYIYTFVAFVWQTFCVEIRSLYAVVSTLLWTSVIVMMLTVVCIVLCKKVKDGIGCLKETGLVLSLTLAVMLISLFLDMVVSQPVSIFVTFVFYAIAPLVQGIIPLYGGLFFLHKLEKAGEAIHEEIVVQAADSSMSVIQAADLPMYIFLRQYENYRLFREYLSHCWAVENLLFLQNVAILTQILQQFVDEDMNQVDIGHQADRVWMQCSFDYLANELKKYNATLSSIGIAEKNKSFEDVKQNVFTMYRAIYEEFVQYGAFHEVNLSSEQRAKLAFLFETEQNCEKFQSWSDFVHVFDEAMFEVYQLTLSMYNFDFKQYIKQNALTENRE